jgi:hypothetical protein
MKDTPAVSFARERVRGWQGRGASPTRRLFVLAALGDIQAGLTDAAGVCCRARCIASHLSLEADQLKPGDMPSVHRVHPQHDLGERETWWRRRMAMKGRVGRYLSSFLRG